MEEDILLERRGAVAVLTLNRPARRNAFTAATNRLLLRRLDALAAEDWARALVLTGAGSAFCAGADLRALGGFDGEPDTDWGSPRGMIDVPARLRALPLPSVCALNGVAAGAGFGIALGTDLRVASEAASFVAAQVRAAQVVDGGLSHFLPRTVGLECSLRIALLGKPVAAREALALGLVGEVVPPEDLLPRSLALAEDLAAGPRTSIRLTREAIYRGASAALEEALEFEYRALIEANRDPDAAEALAAFAAKRPPRFR